MTEPLEPRASQDQPSGESDVAAEAVAEAPVVEPEPPVAEPKPVSEPESVSEPEPVAGDGSAEDALGRLRDPGPFRAPPIVEAGPTGDAPPFDGDAKEASYTVHPSHEVPTQARPSQREKC